MAFSRAALTGVVVVLALAGCGQRPAARAEEGTKSAIAVTETTAALGTIAAVLSYSGSVTPRWSVNVMPKISGSVSELKVQQGQTVDGGDLLAVLDHRSLDDQLAQANAGLASAEAKLRTALAGARSEDIAAARSQADAAQAAVTQAGANLEAAKQKLAQAEAGGRAEVVAQARAKLDADQAVLDKLLNGPISHDVTSAKLAVEQAKDSLFAAQINRDALCAGVRFGQTAPTGAPVICEAAQANVLAAQTAVDQANTSLAKLQAPARSEDVSQARAAVEADRQALAVASQPYRTQDIAQLQQAVVAAGAQVTQAQHQSNAARAAATKAANPYTPEDVDQARAAVEVARAAAHSAQTAVDDARIVAPATGIVSEVPVAVGSLVSPQSPVVTLISASLEVDVTVEEGQVASIGQGQPAHIHAHSASEIPGQVLIVAPQGDPRTRKFTVKVVPAVAESPLRAGMSATVDIQTGRQEQAVLVPRTAVMQRNGQQIVFVDDAGHAKMVPVKTGYTDDTQVQIQNGIEAGAMVILPGSIELADGDAVRPASSVPAAP